MTAEFYIVSDTAQDGPHDLVTVMRRIRAGKIGPDTLLKTSDQESPVKASDCPETAMFFSRPTSASEISVPALDLNFLVLEGWRFTSQHSVLTAFSGGMVLMGLLIASAMTQAMGLMPGILLSLIVYMMMNQVFFAVCLRLYRGQPFSSRFINEQFFPALQYLLFSGIVLGMMLFGGFLLLIIPAMLILWLYAFVPFLILDRQLSLIPAMHASRMLLMKLPMRHRLTLALLIVGYFACTALIFPLPLATPLLAGILSRTYEELLTL